MPEVWSFAILCINNSNPLPPPGNSQFRQDPKIKEIVERIELARKEIDKINDFIIQDIMNYSLISKENTFSTEVTKKKELLGLIEDELKKLLDSQRNTLPSADTQSRPLRYKGEEVLAEY
jgi:hypothetical protein